jgi:hypothetical protein
MEKRYMLNDTIVTNDGATIEAGSIVIVKDSMIRKTNGEVICTMEYIKDNNIGLEEIVAEEETDDSLNINGKFKGMYKTLDDLRAIPKSNNVPVFYGLGVKDSDPTTKEDIYISYTDIVYTPEDGDFGYSVLELAFDLTNTDSKDNRSIALTKEAMENVIDIYEPIIKMVTVDGKLDWEQLDTATNREFDVEILRTCIMLAGADDELLKTEYKLTVVHNTDRVEDLLCRYLLLHKAVILQNKSASEEIVSDLSSVLNSDTTINEDSFRTLVWVNDGPITQEAFLTHYKYMTLAKKLGDVETSIMCPSFIRFSDIL